MEGSETFILDGSPKLCTNIKENSRSNGSDVTIWDSSEHSEQEVAAKRTR